MTSKMSDFSEIKWKILHLKTTQHHFLFYETIPRLLKIIHRVCSKQFYVGAIFFLPDDAALHLYLREGRHLIKRYLHN